MNCRFLNSFSVVSNGFGARLISHLNSRS
ncbi:hypothetical protein GI288_19570 [Salmonella enterica subsp. enterica serovar Montevideo]|nr:hypothetical protein [Salmonella enterica subsp. enterica serovar Montevideo]